MHKLLILFAIFCPAFCKADMTTMSIPGQDWKVTFNAPVTSKIKEDSSPSQYYYQGNSGRFNLSLIVEPPSCTGEITAEDNLKCFAPKIENVPGLVKQTIKVNRVAKGIQITYLAYVPMNDTSIKILHTHILFAYQGKWGDLHGSIIKPTAEEIAMLLSLGDQFDYFE